MKMCHGHGALCHSVRVSAPGVIALVEALADARPLLTLELAWGCSRPAWHTFLARSGCPQPCVIRRAEVLGPSPNDQALLAAGNVTYLQGVHV